jgi:hypothetical protein
MALIRANQSVNECEAFFKRNGPKNGHFLRFARAFEQPRKGFQ